MKYRIIASIVILAVLILVAVLMKPLVLPDTGNETPPVAPSHSDNGFKM